MKTLTYFNLFMIKYDYLNILSKYLDEISKIVLEKYSRSFKLVAVIRLCIQDPKLF